jgi:uncharacterized membrane protein
MSHAEGSVVINCPISTVFDFILDGENAPRWRPAVTDAKLVTSGPLGVGSRFKQGLRGPSGGRIDGDYEIVECRQNHWIRFQVTAGPARPTGTYKFEESGDGTKVTFALDYEPKGFARLMGPMITRNMWREVATLENLKKQLEETGR